MYLSLALYFPIKNCKFAKESTMKMFILLLITLPMVISCGQNNTSSDNSRSNAYKYSYCGTVQGSTNMLQLYSNGQVYNLTYEGQNSQIMNALASQANTSQQTCVYTNIQAQYPVNTGGYQGYSIATIVVQSIGNQSDNNYTVSFCGSIYQGGALNSGNVYYIQTNSNNSAIVNYTLNANNNTVLNQLYQVSSQARQGCVYSMQNVMNSQYGQVINVDHITLN